MIHFEHYPTLATYHPSYAPLSAAVCGVTVFLCATLNAIGGIGADELSTKVLAAWEQRLASMKSFQYQCDVEWVQNVDLNSDGGISNFGTPTSKNPILQPVTLRCQLMFCMDGRKFASKYIGEQWSDQKKAPVPTNFQVCFDGRDDKWLSQGGSLPHGHVSIRGNMQKSHLSSDISFIGLWLGYSPKAWLTRKGFLLDKMTVRNRDAVNDDGMHCIELSLPRKGTEIGFLYVDPANGYVPVKLLQQLAGITEVQHLVSYRPFRDAFWGVSSWNSTYFDKSGELKETHTGKTNSLSVNEPIDDNVFQLEFPVGTQIIEENAGVEKCYIQEAGGRRLIGLPLKN